MWWSVSLALQVAPVSYYCLNFFIGLRPKLGNTYYHITEEGHTIQWLKENQQRTNNDLQNITQTKDWAAPTPLTSGVVGSIGQLTNITNIRGCGKYWATPTPLKSGVVGSMGQNQHH